MRRAGGDGPRGGRITTPSTPSINNNSINDSTPASNPTTTTTNTVNMKINGFPDKSTTATPPHMSNRMSSRKSTSSFPSTTLNTLAFTNSDPLVTILTRATTDLHISSPTPSHKAQNQKRRVTIQLDSATGGEVSNEHDGGHQAGDGNDNDDGEDETGRKTGGLISTSHINDIMIDQNMDQDNDLDVTPDDDDDDDDGPSHGTHTSTGAEVVFDCQYSQQQQQQQQSHETTTLATDDPDDTSRRMINSQHADYLDDEMLALLCLDQPGFEGLDVMWRNDDERENGIGASLGRPGIHRGAILDRFSLRRRSGTEMEETSSGLTRSSTGKTTSTTNTQAHASNEDGQRFGDMPSARDNTKTHTRRGGDGIFGWESAVDDTLMDPVPLPSLEVSPRQFVKVLDDGVTISYIGKGNHSYDVGVARSRTPFHVRQGVGYFEITVIDSGLSGDISIGLLERNAPTNRHPGLDTDRYGFGYHNDGTKSYKGNTTPFGPRFSDDDVIGCGYCFEGRQVFFTLNGRLVAVAFKGAVNDKDKDKNAVVPVNFGMVGDGDDDEDDEDESKGKSTSCGWGVGGFVFDLEGYIKQLRKVNLDKVSSIEVPGSVMHSLVTNYLLQEGFANTLKSFLGGKEKKEDGEVGIEGIAEVLRGGVDSATGKGKETKTGDSGLNVDEGDATLLSSLILRKDIRNFILRGDIPKARELIDTMFPTLSTSSNDVNNPRKPEKRSANHSHDNGVRTGRKLNKERHQQQQQRFEDDGIFDLVAFPDRVIGHDVFMDEDEGEDEEPDGHGDQHEDDDEFNDLIAMDMDDNGDESGSIFASSNVDIKGIRGRVRVLLACQEFIEICRKRWRIVAGISEGVNSVQVDQSGHVSVNEVGDVGNVFARGVKRKADDVGEYMRARKRVREEGNDKAVDEEHDDDDDEDDGPSVIERVKARVESSSGKKVHGTWLGVRRAKTSQGPSSETISQIDSEMLTLMRTVLGPLYKRMENQSESGFSDDRVVVGDAVCRKLLEDVVGFAAYTGASDLPRYLRSYFDMSHREQVADYVNMAILAASGHPSFCLSKLDILLRQVVHLRYQARSEEYHHSASKPSAATGVSGSNSNSTTGTGNISRTANVGTSTTTSNASTSTTGSGANTFGNGRATFADALSGRTRPRQAGVQFPESRRERYVIRDRNDEDYWNPSVTAGGRTVAPSTSIVSRAPSRWNRTDGEDVGNLGVRRRSGSVWDTRLGGASSSGSGIGLGVRGFLGGDFNGIGASGSGGGGSSNNNNANGGVNLNMGARGGRVFRIFGTGALNSWNVSSGSTSGSGSSGDDRGGDGDGESQEMGSTWFDSTQRIGFSDVMLEWAV
ncbi:hypothetical protein HDU76_009827 [Blyttiomyces sp. JEL0837]|nr:hypothetical protein HDU76_009827 [Blyttiomyces sp. JEL0837]